MTSIVTNSDTPWLCLKHPERDIFYWVHSKCACSYYKIVLKKILGWNECTTRDINWGMSRVFSHIRDPLYKHRTGLIEYFYHHKCEDILHQNFSNHDFWMMLSKAAWLDVHSMSIHQHLDSKADFIHWIPIDGPGRDHLQETLEYIGFDGDIARIKNIPKVNVSQGFKKDCVEKLLSLCPDPLIIKYLEKDRVIYDKSISTKFEPPDYQEKLDQLLQQNWSRAEAEAELDRQVADGRYLRW